MNRSAPTLHPIHELIRARWSPRAFADRDVPPELLCSLLEAARWAASCFNEQPWSFLVATRDRPEDHARICACLVESNQVWARRAPVLMISVAKLAFSHNGRPNRHAMYDVGAASTQMALEAASHGLQLHFMAGFDVQKARETLHIPDGYEPTAAIALGYPGDPETLPEALRTKETGPRLRKPLASFAFGADWETHLDALGD